MSVFRAAVNQALDTPGGCPNADQLELGPRPSVCGGRGADLRLLAQLKAAVRRSANCDRFGLGHARIGHARGFNLQRFLQKKGGKCDPNDTGATKLRSLETAVFDG
jgi:hypothetical protein